jgi:hypothetical protein
MKSTPKPVDAIYELSEKAKAAEILIQERITQIKRKIVSVRFNTTEIKFGYILTHPSGKTILYEILERVWFQFRSIESNL